MYSISMNIKSSKELVEEANKVIKTIEPSAANEANNKGEITLIDLRDIRELWKNGTVNNSIHIPRGMLEFWLDPKSEYFQKNKIEKIRKIGLYCALGLRSALATKTLNEMGFKNVFNVKGGFEALKKEGAKIIPKIKK